MNIQQVRTWNCDGKKSIAENPYIQYHEYRGELNDQWVKFEQWANNASNQPSTELTGTYSGDEVEIKEVWEYRGVLSDEWAKDRDTVYSRYGDYANYSKCINEMCDEAETRQSFQLIAKPVSKEALQGNEIVFDWGMNDNGIKTNGQYYSKPYGESIKGIVADYRSPIPKMETTENKSKEGILKKAFPIAETTGELRYSELDEQDKKDLLNAMQEYASQQTEPLIKALEWLLQTRTGPMTPEHHAAIKALKEVQK